MNKGFATCILAAVMTLVLIRVYPSTSSAFAQNRPIGTPQGGLQRVVNPPTTTDLMNAIASLKQTVDSENQTIAQLRQASLTEAQNVRDIAGRLGVACIMTSRTYLNVYLGGGGVPKPDPYWWCEASGWGNDALQQYTQPFYGVSLH